MSWEDVIKNEEVSDSLKKYAIASIMLVDYMKYTRELAEAAMKSEDAPMRWLAKRVLDEREEMRRNGVR